MSVEADRPDPLASFIQTVLGTRPSEERRSCGWHEVAIAAALRAVQKRLEALEQFHATHIHCTVDGQTSRTEIDTRLWSALCDVADKAWRYASFDDRSQIYASLHRLSLAEKATGMEIIHRVM